MSDFSLWEHATEDHEAVAHQAAVTEARVALAPLWTFLAAAVAPDDYANRRAVVAERIEAVCASLAEGAAFAVLHGAVLSAFDADFDILHRQRLAQRKLAEDSKPFEIGDRVKVTGLEGWEGKITFYVGYDDYAGVHKYKVRRGEGDDTQTKIWNHTSLEKVSQSEVAKQGELGEPERGTCPNCGSGQYRPDLGYCAQCGRKTGSKNSAGGEIFANSTEPSTYFNDDGHYDGFYRPHNSYWFGPYSSLEEARGGSSSYIVEIRGQEKYTYDGGTDKGVKKGGSKKIAAPEGWWPQTPSQRWPGEDALTCPACGSQNVTISGGPLGGPGNPYGRPTGDSLTCGDCGKRQWFPPKTGAKTAGEIGPGVYSLTPDSTVSVGDRVRWDGDMANIGRDGTVTAVDGVYMDVKWDEWVPGSYDDDTSSPYSPASRRTPIALLDSARWHKLSTRRQAALPDHLKPNPDDPDCPDCKGSGKAPKDGDIEDCDTCEGSGNHPDQAKQSRRLLERRQIRAMRTESAGRRDPRLRFIAEIPAEHQRPPGAMCTCYRNSPAAGVISEAPEDPSPGDPQPGEFVCDQCGQMAEAYGAGVMWYWDPDFHAGVDRLFGSSRTAGEVPPQFLKNKKKKDGDADAKDDGDADADAAPPAAGAPAAPAADDGSGHKFCPECGTAKGDPAAVVDPAAEGGIPPEATDEDAAAGPGFAPGAQVGITYTLADGTTGELDGTFKADQGDGTMMFTCETGDFGVTQAEDGTWTDAAGTTFQIEPSDAAAAPPPGAEQQSTAQQPPAQKAADPKKATDPKAARRACGTCGPKERGPDRAAMRKGAPFAGYDDFADCVSKNADKEDPDAYCGSIKHKVEDTKKARLATRRTASAYQIAFATDRAWFDAFADVIEEAEASMVNAAKAKIGPTSPGNTRIMWLWNKENDAKAVYEVDLTAGRARWLSTMEDWNRTGQKTAADNWVTTGEWGVSYTGYHPCTLNVYKTDDTVPNQWGGMGIVLKHPEHDGKVFDDIDQASAYAASHGLLQRFSESPEGQGYYQGSRGRRPFERKAELEGDPQYFIEQGIAHDGMGKPTPGIYEWRIVAEYANGFDVLGRFSSQEGAQVAFRRLMAGEATYTWTGARTAQNTGALEELAQGIVRQVEEDGDIIDLFDQAAERLAPLEKSLLAEMLDLCPMHFCDVEICADDDVQSCKAVREEGVRRSSSRHQADLDEDFGSPASCPMCSGELMLLGELGSREVARCRNCGITVSIPAGDDSGEDVRIEGRRPTAARQAATDWTGDQYEQGRDVADIAKLIRADLKAAQGVGGLPAGLKFSVKISRFSGGVSCDVRVQGMSRSDPGSRDVENAITAIVNAYKRDRSDSQSDYWNVNFYSDVNFTAKVKTAEVSVREAQAAADVIGWDRVMEISSGGLSGATGGELQQMVDEANEIRATGARSSGMGFGVFTQTAEQAPSTMTEAYEDRSSPDKAIKRAEQEWATGKFVMVVVWDQAIFQKLWENGVQVSTPTTLGARQVANNPYVPGNNPYTQQNDTGMGAMDGPAMPQPLATPPAQPVPPPPTPDGAPPKQPGGAPPGGAPDDDPAAGGSTTQVKQSRRKARMI